MNARTDFESRMRRDLTDMSHDGARYTVALLTGEGTHDEVSVPWIGGPNGVDIDATHESAIVALMAWYDAHASDCETMDDECEGADLCTVAPS